MGSLRRETGILVGDSQEHPCRGLTELSFDTICWNGSSSTSSIAFPDRAAPAQPGPSVLPAPAAALALRTSALLVQFRARGKLVR